MGVFDDLAEAAFKKDADGSEVYYPSGVLERGRLVADPQRRRKLFNYHKRILKYVVPLSTLYGTALGFGGITRGHLIFIGVVLVLLVGRQRYLIRGLPTHGEKLKASEAVSRGAKAFHPAFLAILALSSLALIVSGAALPIWFGVPFEEASYAMLGIVSMGLLGLATSIYLLRARKSDKSVQPT